MACLGSLWAKARRTLDTRKYVCQFRHFIYLCLLSGSSTQLVYHYIGSHNVITLNVERPLNALFIKLEKVS